MKIEVKKFGKILNGRPAGREAALILKQILQEVEKEKKIVLDFEGVLVLTPSYADEFLHNLVVLNYEIRIINASQLVKDTLTAIALRFKS